MLEGMTRLETLCRNVQDTLNAPVVQVCANGAVLLVKSVYIWPIFNVNEQICKYMFEIKDVFWFLFLFL